MIISTSTNKDFLINLLKDSQDYKTQKGTNKIVVRLMRNGLWNQISTLPKRNINTMFLNENILDDLISDLSNFLQNENLYLNNAV